MPKIERAVEIVQNSLARKVGRRIAEPLLKSRMNMGADDRRHDGFAVERDPSRACRRRDFALAADAAMTPPSTKQRPLSIAAPPSPELFARLEQGDLSCSRPRCERSNEREQGKQCD